MTLEEAIDLAESEVQGIVSLVNVLYTDQVRNPRPPAAAVNSLCQALLAQGACSVSLAAQARSVQKLPTSQAVDVRGREQFD